MGKHQGVARVVTQKTLALRRLGGSIGLVTDTNVLESPVDKALNSIINARLSAAKRALEAGEADTYTALMKGICSDVRILAERAVEDELLSKVVQRFRRSIVTKDKLTLLVKINDQDCRLIDGVMSRFSVFEHSQPAEMPASLPSYDEVLREAQALRDWVLEFRSRTSGS